MAESGVPPSKTSLSRLPPAGPWIWVLSFCAWTLLGLMSFGQDISYRTYRGMPIEWGRLPTVMADWLTCGLFTPAFYWMVRRFPIRGRQWQANVLAHLAASGVLLIAKVVVYTPIFRWLNPGVERTFGGMLAGGFFADLLGYWAAVGVLHAVEYYRESQARSLEAAQLDTALRSAALENLRAQLQPHFLFNTLQAISTLIHRDAKAADSMLTDLSDLLRLSLRHAAAQEVPLRDELGFLNRYLDIMRTRFGDRLSIEVVVGADLLDAMVPSLVLQPLVENSIRHGMAERNDHGHVAVSSRREGASLILEVSDDGPGLGSHSSAGDGNGIGLANTRERLQRMYGTGHGIEVVPGSTGDTKPHGLTVRLTIPFRTQTAQVPG